MSISTVADAPVARFSEATIARFDQEVVKYPPEQRRSAILACLAIVQDEQGWISPESEKALARYLDIEPISVHEATTFYDMCNTQPVGRYKINMCTNLPCQLHGAARALKHLTDKLGIEDGQTTADGLFTVAHCECLGACADAPVMIVNDRSMCSFMTEDRLDQLVAELTAAEGKA
ncbi:MAG: NADH-quinone oxidoreductase subunit NuoE [Ottowia sp.]|nr:NADH-quinone oxidoreductase subunit NuoE [Ottowia sp.]